MNEETWENEQWAAGKKLPEEEQRNEKQVALDQELDREAPNAVKRAPDIIVQKMKKEEHEKTVSDVVEKVPKFVPPTKEVWDAIEEVQANTLLSEQDQELLKAYLTTGQTQSELRGLAGGINQSKVNKHIYKSMATVFPYLPEEMQEKYDIAENVIRARSTIQTPASRKRISKGWEIEKPRETGKTKGHNKGNRTNHPYGPGDIKYPVYERTGGRGKKRVFSETHREHLSEANFRRWERQREQEARDASSQEEQVVVDFTQTPHEPPPEAPDK